MVDGILITGGAGYIGSHIVKSLIDVAAKRIVVLDNLSTGFADAVLDGAKFVQGDIQNTSLLSKIIEAENIQAVIHLAASTVIPESISHPLRYYYNNTVGMLNVLQACIKNQVKHFIYSSTAAVYGPCKTKILETHLVAPTNPYGYSKWMGEQMLKDASHAHNINYVILRYFNVAGADPTLVIGQRTPNATHLLKVAVQSACHQTKMPIFGDDYPTSDGTCIRDFIHVSDLAAAHLNALSYLREGGENVTLNCGYGHGFSVKEVIHAVEAVSQKKLPTVLASRRKGDLAQVVADNTLIKQLLKWQPQYDDLLFIAKTAFEFEKKIQKLR